MFSEEELSQAGQRNNIILISFYLNTSYGLEYKKAA